MTLGRYQLAAPWMAPFSAVLLVLLAGLGVWILASHTPAETGIPFPYLFGGLWFAALALNGYRLVTCIREIEVRSGDEIELVSWVQRTRLHPREILAVRSLLGRRQRIVIRHQAGTALLAGPFDQFHCFLNELKQANPAVEITGL